MLHIENMGLYRKCMTIENKIKRKKFLKNLNHFMAEEIGYFLWIFIEFNNCNTINCAGCI
jgi:hypothetical protein